MENEIVTIITGVSSVIFGIFIKLQKDYTDKLKISYDEKVLMLTQRLDKLENKCSDYEDRIEKLNQKVIILQEEFEINIPVIIHDVESNIIYKNKEAQYKDIDLDLYKEFFKLVPRNKKMLKEIYIDNKLYLLASTTKNFPLNSHIISFFIEKV